LLWYVLPPLGFRTIFPPPADAAKVEPPVVLLVAPWLTALLEGEFFLPWLAALLEGEFFLPWLAALLEGEFFLPWLAALLEGAFLAPLGVLVLGVALFTPWVAFFTPWVATRGGVDTCTGADTCGMVCTWTAAVADIVAARLNKPTPAYHPITIARRCAEARRQFTSV
jgi:hypothetical protein